MRTFFDLLANVVGIDLLNDEGRLHCCEKLRCLFFVFIEVPKPHFVVICCHQFVVLIVKVHRNAARGFELKQELLGYQVIFVDDTIHRQ